ncbi:MAG: hypothetical protein ACRDNK_10215 [Solirubrobacteraceae bacterium]
MTKTRKDGSRGKLRIDYGDPHQPDAPIKWLWKFIDGARNAGELYGRALVVIAAEQYASRLVVPTSQRSRPTAWSSHKDHAAKALRKLAGPHLPASLRQLENAIKRAHREYTAAERGALNAIKGESALAAAEDVDHDQAIDIDQDAGELDERLQADGDVDRDLAT